MKKRRIISIIAVLTMIVSILQPLGVNAELDKSNKAKIEMVYLKVGSNGTRLQELEDGESIDDFVLQEDGSVGGGLKADSCFWVGMKISNLTKMTDSTPEKNPYKSLQRIAVGLVYDTKYLYPVYEDPAYYDEDSGEVAQLPVTEKASWAPGLTNNSTDDQTLTRNMLPTVNGTTNRTVLNPVGAGNTHRLSNSNKTIALSSQDYAIGGATDTTSKEIAILYEKSNDANTSANDYFPHDEGVFAIMRFKVKSVPENGAKVFGIDSAPARLYFAFRTTQTYQVAGNADVVTQNNGNYTDPGVRDYYYYAELPTVAAPFPIPNQKHNVTIAPADAHGGVIVKQGSSAVTGESNVYAFEEGKSYTITPSNNAGYRFKNWTFSVTQPTWITEDTTTHVLSVNIPAGTENSAIPTITANFEEDAYYISVTAGANGSVAVKQGNTALTAETSGANAGKYKLGRSGTYTATATANDYYKFKAWSGGSTKADNPLTITETMATSGLTAEFEAKVQPTMVPAQAEGKSVNVASPQNINIAFTPNDYPFDATNTNVKKVYIKKGISSAETELTFGTGDGHWAKNSSTNEFVIPGANFSGLVAGTKGVQIRIVMNDAANEADCRSFTIPIEITDSTPKTKKVTAVTLPTTTTYTYGDAISLAGMTVTVEESQGSNVLGTTTHTFGASGWDTDPGVTLKVNNKNLTNGMTTLTVADSSKPIVASLGGATVQTTGGFTINKKTVDVKVTGTVSKVYDKNNNMPSSASFAGAVTTTGVTGVTVQSVSTTGVNFPTTDVASDVTVTGFTASNITLSDTANYAVGNVTSEAKASVTPKELTVQISTKPSTQVDGATTVDITNSVRLVGVLEEEDVKLGTVTAVFTDVATAGEKDIQIRYADPALTGTRAGNYTLKKTETGKGTVQNYYVTDLEMTGKPTKLSYTNGEYLDHTGMVVKETRSNNVTVTYMWNTDHWDVTYSDSTAAATINALSEAGITPAWRLTATNEHGNVLDTSFTPEGHAYHGLYRTKHNDKCLYLVAKGENGAWVSSNTTDPFTIGAQKVDITISGSMSKAYDGTDSLQGATVNITGDVTTDVSDEYPVTVQSIDQTNIKFPSANAGDGTIDAATIKNAIQLSDSYNYEVGEVTGSVNTSISKITINVTAGDIPEYVIGSNRVVAVTDYTISPDLIAGDEDDVTINVTGTYPENAQAGTADVAMAVSATGDKAGNYNFVIDPTATGVVTEAEVTEVKITAGAATGGTYVYSVDGGAETSADTEVAGVGKPVVVTVTPTDSSFNTSVTVRETNGSRSVSVKNDGNNKYSFEVPRYDVTITVLCSAPSSNGVSGGGTPSYSVKFDAGQYGTITGKSSISVSRNGKVTNESLPEVTAKEGYKFLGWSIDGKEVVDVTAAAVTKNVTYVALYEEVAEVTPSPEPTPAISEDYLKPYATGYDDGMFLPDDYITRAELAAMLARLINEGELETDYTTYFNDINGDEWYTKYIGFLESKGVMSGYEDGSFKPGQTITRAEMCAAIARAQGFALITNDELFTDIADSWAHSYIATLASKNIVTGYEDGSFDPQSSLTRAETVTIVNRLLKPSKAIVEFTPSDIAGHWAEAGIILAVNERELLD